MTVRILFVSANPHWEERLDLAEEQRLLMRELKHSDAKLILLPAAQPEELQAALKYEQPDIVHFAGHATATDGILLRNAEGESLPVPPAELGRSLRHGSVKLVVLNACRTSVYGNELAEVVDCVVTTTQPLADGAGKMFTRYLYRALVAGRSVNQAFVDTVARLQRSHLTSVYEQIGRASDVVPFSAHDENAGGELVVEGLGTWDDYFYLSYLDDQIRSLERHIHWNQFALGGLIGLGIGAAIAVAHHNIGSWHDLVTLSWWGQWLYPLMEYRAQLIGDQPLLPWLVSVGASIPLAISFLQQRMLVHGNEQLLALRSLRDLLSKADELSQEVRERLHRLLDQTLRGALLK